MIRCYPTSDEKFYIGETPYKTDLDAWSKKRTQLKPLLFPKYNNESHIAFWRDIHPPKETILDHELCFKDWRLSRVIRCACLPVAGTIKRIKLMKAFPAGFLSPPRILSLEEVRRAAGTLVTDKVAAGLGGKGKEKGGKGKKGKNGKKGKKGKK